MKAKDKRKTKERKKLVELTYEVNRFSVGRKIHHSVVRPTQNYDNRFYEETARASETKTVIN